MLVEGTEEGVYVLGVPAAIYRPALSHVTELRPRPLAVDSEEVKVRHVYEGASGDHHIVYPGAFGDDGVGLTPERGGGAVEHDRGDSLLNSALKEVGFAEGLVDV